MVKDEFCLLIRPHVIMVTLKRREQCGQIFEVRWWPVNGFHYLRIKISTLDEG